MTRGERPWCARCHYPGLEPFIYGTTWVRSDAPQHEAEALVMAAIKADLLKILPHLPYVDELMPGSIFFSEDKE